MVISNLYTILAYGYRLFSKKLTTKPVYNRLLTKLNIIQRRLILAVSDERSPKIKHSPSVVADNGFHMFVIGTYYCK